MKVTSDACLLGARVEVEESQRILDIGAGTGLLSLMAAQRSKATISAIELDQQAARQTQENFSASPWAERLSVFQQSIQSFQDEPYDTIICNPPFFQDALKAPDQQRSMARHTDTLSFADLSDAIDRLMSLQGKAWILLPVDSSEQLLKTIDQSEALFLQRKISIRPSSKHDDHRHILVLGRDCQKVIEEAITIYSQPPEYSEQMQQLLKPYYLFL